MKRTNKAIIVIVLFGFILFSLGGIVFSRYHRELQAHRARLAAAGSQTIDTPCGPIEYAETGTGSPVLVVHGNGGGFDQGLTLAQSYIGAGYRAIVPSRFGYLGTPVPEDATVEMQANAYACLLDALGIQQAPVFTTSAGVTSTIQFALSHPERVSGIILHSPNAPGEVGLLPPPRPIFNAMMHSDFIYWAMSTYFSAQSQVFVGVPKNFTITPEFQADITSALTSVNPVSARGDGMVFDTFIGNPFINELPLEQVTVPALVISAVDDPEALHSSARTLAERIPGARLAPIADGGHLMLGHAAEVCSLVLAFIQETAVAAAP